MLQLDGIGMDDIGFYMLYIYYLYLTALMTYEKNYVMEKQSCFDWNKKYCFIGKTLQKQITKQNFASLFKYM